NLLEAEGNTQQAIATLQAILDDTARKNYSASDANNRAMLLERLGILQRSAGQYAKAIEAFRQIAAVDNEGAPRISVQIIDTYRQAKDFTKAQQEAAAALKKFPDERMIKLVNASLLADMGKVDDAAAQVRGLLKGDRDRETYLSLAQIYDKG